MDDPLFSPSEVAERLGIARSSIYRYFKLFGLPYIQLSEAVRRTRLWDLEAWIASRLSKGEAA